MNGPGAPTFSDVPGTLSFNATSKAALVAGAP